MPRPRAALAVLLSASMLGCLLLASLAPTVSAWANGGDNGYGTHDWIVDQAVKVLDGRAGWFDASVARLASDDPDTLEHGASGDHSYHDVGKRGGAVDRIAREFDLASAAYADGDMSDASYHIGLLSHFLGDIGQPFHTTYSARNKESLHSKYELLIDREFDRASDRPGWSSDRRTVSTIGNVRRTAVATAAYSRSQYPALSKALAKDASKITSDLSAVTGRLMKRIANDLADIIWSISQGAGAQPAIGRLTTWVKWPGVAKNGFEAVFVKAVDGNGKPIEGLKVVVAWPTDHGTRNEVLYTGPDGTQKRIGTAGTTPKRTRITVAASTTVRGVTTSAATWWAITPTLKSGAGGFKTRVSDRTPESGEVVRVTSSARDRQGRGVPNLIVTWTWRWGKKSAKTTGITGADGKARGLQPTASLTTKKRVTVTAVTQSGSHHRTSSSTFKRGS